LHTDAGTGRDDTLLSVEEAAPILYSQSFVTEIDKPAPCGLPFVAGINCASARMAFCVRGTRGRV